MIKKEDIDKQMQIYSKEEKETLVNKEMRRLRLICKDVPKEKLDIALSLMQNVAFLTVSLDELQQSINKNGLVMPYQNGKNQWGYRKNPAVDIYNAMSRNHAALIKELSKLLPKGDNEKDEDDPFLDFIQNRRDD